MWVNKLWKKYSVLQFFKEKSEITYNLIYPNNIKIPKLNTKQSQNSFLGLWIINNLPLIYIFLENIHEHKYNLRRIKIT